MRHAESAACCRAAVLCNYTYNVLQCNLLPSSLCCDPSPALICAPLRANAPQPCVLCLPGWTWAHPRAWCQRQRLAVMVMLALLLRGRCSSSAARSG